MAVSISYPGAYYNCVYVFRATGGGVTFSANLAGAVFDYFTDTAVVNDAIYFSGNAANGGQFANLKVNVGTAMAGTGITGVWEYRSALGWETMHDLTDPTAGFTVPGAATIVFPCQAGLSPAYTVNGVTVYPWIRYRITGITTITEGGANQTAQPTVSTAALTVSGGTDAVPATFKNVYDWIIANAPEIGATNPAPSIFKFNSCRFIISSRLKSLNEQIFIGNGAGLTHDLSYLETGTKVGTDGWKDSSCFFFCTNLGTTMLNTSMYTKAYGAIIGTFTNFINGNNRNFGSYLGIGYGEWIGCSVLNSSGYFTTLTMNKCTVPGALITSVPPTDYPLNLRISDPRTNIWSLYNTGGTIKGVSYAMPSACIINANQYGDGNPQINLINPNPSLPEQTAAVKVLNRSLGTLANITKCFFYDASAGTYTDYSTQAQDATVDDVPLSGDVGDCYYFNLSGWLSYFTFLLSFTITNQANDYVYALEQYRSTGWATLAKAAGYDGTENFTKSGKIYVAPYYANPTVAINGVTGYWVRIRITTKGTGSPTLSRIQAANQTWGSDWKIFEKMSAVFFIVDKAGVAISGATVKLTNVLGTVTTLTTDANGLTTSTDFTISTTQLDPTQSDANFNVSKISMNPYTIQISKSGYKKYTKKMSILSQLNETIALEKVLDNNFSKVVRVESQ